MKNKIVEKICILLQGTNACLCINKKNKVERLTQVSLSSTVLPLWRALTKRNGTISTDKDEWSMQNPRFHISSSYKFTNLLLEKIRTPPKREKTKRWPVMSNFSVHSYPPLTSSTKILRQHQFTLEAELQLCRSFGSWFPKSPQYLQVNHNFHSSTYQNEQNAHEMHTEFAISPCMTNMHRQH